MCASVLGASLILLWFGVDSTTIRLTAARCLVCSTLDYAGGNGFNNSVAVEFRRYPAPCVAVDFNGTGAGDYCAASRSVYQLPSPVVRADLKFLLQVGMVKLPGT